MLDEIKREPVHDQSVSILLKKKKQKTEIFRFLVPYNVVNKYLLSKKLLKMLN